MEKRLLKLISIKSKEFPNNTFFDNYKLLQKTPIKGEVFKTLIYRDCSYDKFFEVSNYGRIRSKPRVVVKGNRWGGVSYSQNFGGNILGVRNNGKCEYLFSTIGYTDTETGIQSYKTIYIGLAVALTFLGEDKDPKKTLITYKDRNRFFCHVSNLEWTDQSFLSTRNMEEATEEVRNALGKTQALKAGLTADKHKLLIKYYDEGYTIKEAAEKAGTRIGSAYYQIRKSKGELNVNLYRTSSQKGIADFFKHYDRTGSVAISRRLAGISFGSAVYQLRKRNKEKESDND